MMLLRLFVVVGGWVGFVFVLVVIKRFDDLDAFGFADVGASRANRKSLCLWLSLISLPLPLGEGWGEGNDNRLNYALR